MASFDGSNDLDAEQIPVCDRMDKEYRIYVDNLPEELKEDAIKQVFSTYGKITGMFYRPNTIWAYITYGSYREAELAIRELNNKKPLYLKVALAKERPINKELEQLSINSGEIQVAETKENTCATKPLFVQNMKRIIQGMGRGYAVHGCAPPVPRMIAPYKCIPSHEGSSSLSAISSIYGNNDPYMSTNNLWTRGVLTVTANGKRHVSFGRGYTMYEIPEPDPACEEYIAQVYELRKNGLYEYGDDELKHELYACVVCFAKTTKHCEKCYTYYCSKACQVTHWPQHQAECERVPDLVDETPLKQVVKDETTKQDLNNTANVQVNRFSDVKLRRPNTSAQSQSFDTNRQRTNGTNQTNENAKTVVKNPSNYLDSKDVSKEEIVDQSVINGTSNKISPNRLNKYNTNENTDQTKKNGQLSTVNRTFTSKIHFNQRSDKNGHIKDNFNDNFGQQHSYQKNGFQNDRKPVCNYREITTTSKQEQKVSTVEVEDQSDNLAAYTTKDLPRSNDAKVKTPQKKSSPNIEKTPLTKLHNILETLANLPTENIVSEQTISGMIQICDHLHDIYGATLLPDGFTTNMEKIINELPEVCVKMTEIISDYKPEVGDLICGEVEKDIWYRGQVTSLSPNVLVALLDEARIVPVLRTLPYPREFLDICSYGVSCEVTNGKLQVDKIYSFTGVIKKHNKESSDLKIIIEKDDVALEAIIKPWHAIKPVPALVKLKNGSKIFISSYRNQYSMFAHSLDELDIEYANDINQRVAHCSQTAPYLSKPATVGQVVIAPYKDGNKYRAIITEIQDKIATIAYIDYGDFMKYNMDEFQEISDDLANKRSCSAKLLLKDVPRNTPMTPAVDTYLRDLTGRQVQLTCTYNDKLFKDGVYLTTSNGENVNDKIKELLKPSWKRADYDDKTCYMLNDMDIAPLGQVGDTIEALVLHQPTADKLTYMMSPSDLDLLTYITSEMPGLIQEYCEKTQYYIPRKSELCLALYDGAWYRAVCLDPKNSQTTCQIFFVDYGNLESVEHENLRQMPETFVIPGALANICTVVNLAPTDTSGNYSTTVKQRVSELVAVNTSVDIKIVEITKNGDYIVELPKVCAVLKKEGLVPNLF